MSSPMELVSGGAETVVHNVVRFPGGGGEISGFAEVCLGLAFFAGTFMIGRAIARSVEGARNTEVQAGPVNWKTSK